MCPSGGRLPQARQEDPDPFPAQPLPGWQILAGEGCAPPRHPQPGEPGKAGLPGFAIPAPADPSTRGIPAPRESPAGPDGRDRKNRAPQPEGWGFPAIPAGHHRKRWYLQEMSPTPYHGQVPKHPAHLLRPGPCGPARVWMPVACPPGRQPRRKAGLRCG